MLAMWVKVRIKPDQRARFLQAIEGLPVGSSARQGMVRENRFYHSDMQFTLAFPRSWQILNEPNSESFYQPKPSAKGYAKVLAAANKAIDARDPAADVVLGGIPQLAGSRKAVLGSAYLEELYAVNGATESFDAIAPAV